MIENPQALRAKRFAQLVAKRLQAEARARDVSGRELARLVGTDYSTLNNYFSGKREIPLSMLVKCSEAIDIGIDVIIKRAHEDFMNEERNDFSKMAAHRPGYSIEEGYEQ